MLRSARRSARTRAPSACKRWSGMNGNPDRFHRSKGSTEFGNLLTLGEVCFAPGNGHRRQGCSGPKSAAARHTFRMAEARNSAGWFQEKRELTITIKITTPIKIQYT